MLTLAHLLRDLGFMLYGGPIVAFAVLISLAPRLGRGHPWHTVRVYQWWGPGLGLSLGACILGLLWGRWLTHGGFEWAWDTTAARWDLAAWGAFLIMWVSNIILEIWTLEALRLLDRDGEVSDEALYRRRLPRLARHLTLHAGLVLLVLVLAVVAQGAA